MHVSMDHFETLHDAECYSTDISDKSTSFNSEHVDISHYQHPIHHTVSHTPFLLCPHVPCFPESLTALDL